MSARPLARSPRRLAVSFAVALIALIGASAAMGEGPPAAAGGTRGPLEIIFSRDGKWAYVAEFDTGTIAVVDVARGAVADRLSSGGQEPTAVALLPDDRTLLAVNSYSGSLVWIDLEKRRQAHSLNLRGLPWDVVVTPDGERAFVSLSQLDQVAAIDLDQRKELGRIAVGKRPQVLALTRNGRKLACANSQSGDVSVIETDFLTETRRLKTRGVNLRGMALVPAGDLGIESQVTLVMASSMVPNQNNHAIQPENGQIWANFAHVLPLEGVEAFGSPGQLQQLAGGRRFPNSDVVGVIWIDPALRVGVQHIVRGDLSHLLLEPAGEGPPQPGRPPVLVARGREMQAAADPYQIALLPNLDVGFVANGGIHAVSAFSLAQAMVGDNPWPGVGDIGFRSGGEEWDGLRPVRGGLVVEQSALGGRGGFWSGFDAIGRGRIRPVLRQQVGLNPRALALSPDRERLWVANHLGSTISVLDVQTMQVERTIDLGKPDRADPAFAGRGIFNDGFATKEQWFTCASCHPDGMSVGRNWKFAHVADEFPELRNTRMLRGGVHQTAPFRWSGHDQALEQFIQDEVTGLQKGKPRSEPELRALATFVASLKLPPNPHRTPSNVFTSVAMQGRALFTGKAGCLGCHHGPLHGGSGQRAWVGTRPEGKTIDVPHLAGVVNSAPYLHDGRAASLEAIFQRHNPNGQHGRAHELTEAELGAVLEYVRQL